MSYFQYFLETSPYLESLQLTYINYELIIQISRSEKATLHRILGIKFCREKNILSYGWKILFRNNSTVLHFRFTMVFKKIIVTYIIVFYKIKKIENWFLNRNICTTLLSSFIICTLKLHKKKNGYPLNFDNQIVLVKYRWTKASGSF